MMVHAIYSTLCSMNLVAPVFVGHHMWIAEFSLRVTSLTGELECGRCEIKFESLVMIHVARQDTEGNAVQDVVVVDASGCAVS